MCAGHRSLNKFRPMRVPSHLPLPVGGGFHRPYKADRPETGEDPRLLCTLPYCDLIELLAETMFPENVVVDPGGVQVPIMARDVRIDRYAVFRAAWDQEFGINLQLALLDFSEGCGENHPGQHFATLDAAARTAFVGSLSKGSLATWSIGRRNANPADDQRLLFGVLHKFVIGGMFGDPCYGGNYRGLGWFYSNFTPIP